MGALLPAAAVEADTAHVTIARYESLTNQQNQVTSVVGETVVMVGLIDTANPFLRAVTVNPSDGSIKGSALRVNIPAGPCYPSRPVEMIYSRHFLPGYALVVGRGIEVGTLPIAVQSSGTPVAGSWGCLTLPTAASSSGKPTAVAEIPGIGFTDGRPRLFIGTDSGVVIEYSRSSSGSMTLHGQWDLGGTSSIFDLGPIPQLSGIMLGVASGTKLAGYRMGLTTPNKLFELTHPDGSRVRAFRSFEPGDRLLSSSTTELHVAFCDGQSDRPFYTTLPATVAGFWSLDVILQPPSFPLPPGGGPLPFSAGIALLVGGQGDVYYRPGYLNGASMVGCAVQVSENLWQPCAPCPIVITGDVDNSGAISATDIIRMVNFVFRNGVAPQPCRASGDVNCSGGVNASDLIGMVNYVYKSGTPPCNVCTEFNGTWSCP